MIPEEVAQQFAESRPGMDLVNWFEVGLPFWKLQVVCTFVERKPIPPIEEFILRSITSGLTTAEEISGFLGLDERLSVAAIADMLYGGFLRTVAAGRYALTDYGAQVLEACEFLVTQQEPIAAYYDGLTHDTLFLTDTDLVAPRDLKERGIREWPAFPADAPGVEEIDLHGIRKSWEAKDFHRKKGKEIISIDEIVGKRLRLYLEAVALVFQSTDPSERPQVAFAVDGRLSQAHESAFAEATGERKHNVLASLRQSPDAQARPLLGAHVEQARKPEVLEAVGRVEKMKAELQAVERKTRALSGSSKTQELQDEVERLRSQLAEAEAGLKQFTSRRVPVQEHPSLLRSALTEATERVMIISPWIRAAVVDLDFLGLLKSTLERGVAVTIAYGIGGREGDGDPMAIKAIEGLKKHGHLELTRLGNTHAKVLVKDHDWVVVTSFNWLSFKGDPNRPIRDERGFYCSDPDQVDGVFDEYAGMMAGGRS